MKPVCRCIEHSMFHMLSNRTELLSECSETKIMIEARRFMEAWKTTTEALNDTDIGIQKGMHHL